MRRKDELPGAGYVFSVLQEAREDQRIPSTRSIQRRWAKAGNPRTTKRQRQASNTWTKEVHHTWQIDGKEQITLANGSQVPRPPGSVHTHRPCDDWATATIGDEAAGGLVRDGSFVAVTADGEWVALAAARRGEEPGVLEGMLTGVAAAWQRRGLGTAVKVAAAHWAKAAGWERLYVGTAGVNTGMRAINDALGFKPMPGWSRWMKPVASAGASAPR